MIFKMFPLRRMFESVKDKVNPASALQVQYSFQSNLLRSLHHFIRDNMVLSFDLLWSNELFFLGKKKTEQIYIYEMKHKYYALRYSCSFYQDTLNETTTHMNTIFFFKKKTTYIYETTTLHYDILYIWVMLTGILRVIVNKL